MNRIQLAKVNHVSVEHVVSGINIFNFEWLVA